MTDLLEMFSGARTLLEKAIVVIAEDDVLSLRALLTAEGGDVTEDTQLPKSPQENLLTHAINRNADNCVMYLVHELHWSVVVNMDTIFCPLRLCLIQCFLPVCYQLFRATDIDFEKLMLNAPKGCSALLKYIVWPMDVVPIQNSEADDEPLAREVRINEGVSYEGIESLMSLCRASIRRHIKAWMVESHNSKKSTPNYFYLINKLPLPVSLIYFLAYSELWPHWDKNQTKPYRGRPRVPHLIDILS